MLFLSLLIGDMGLLLIAKREDSHNNSDSQCISVNIGIYTAI